MTVKYTITCEDFMEMHVATQAIASYRINKKCKCDRDVGFVCDFCIRWENQNDSDALLAIMQRYEDVVFKHRVQEVKDDKK
jgi:hypothetical protein